MKKNIERMLLSLVGIFLIFTVCAAYAHADLLYEPDDDFYRRHREECKYESRIYIADGPDDVLIVYKSPESSRETGRIKNGQSLIVNFLYVDESGITWAQTDRNDDDICGWFPLEYAYAKYDFEEFMREYGKQFKEENGYITGKEIVIWEYPGGEIDGTISLDNGSAIEYYITFTDEEGRKWAAFDYYMGYRDFWCCVDDLTADEQKLYPEGRPLRDTREREKPKKGRIIPGKEVPSGQIFSVLIAVAAVMGVSVFLLWRMRKR